MIRRSSFPIVRTHTAAQRDSLHANHDHSKPSGHDHRWRADLLDDKQAAALLTVSWGTLGVWRSTGRYNLPFVKVGRMVRYRRADLLAWLEKRYRESGATA